MKSTKTLYWTIQTLSWGAFIMLVGAASFLQNEFSSETLLRLFILFALLVFSSHTIKIVLVKLHWLDLKIAELLPRAIILVLFLSTALLLVESGINLLFPDAKKITVEEGILNILLYTLFFFMWTAVYFAYHLVQKSREQEINNLKLQANKTENELKNLRDQLNPHFLFNSLNSIRALVVVDPDEAKSAITTLSNLLRSSLYLGKKSFIYLKEEVDLIEQYLLLEKIRYEERLNYEINNEVLNSIKIPPFILQGMVENAIKHGVSKSAEPSIIDINIYFAKGKLFLEVINSGKYVELPDRGIGIENTIKRLKILYGSNAGFEINNVNNKVKAYIWIEESELNSL